MSGVAVLAAIASVFANAGIRPWEYYNELVGGPEKAYLRFADEGIDMGQRSLDLVRHYHERLEPAGEIPYNFYPIRRQELRRRNVHARSLTGGPEADLPSPDMSGVFLVRAVSVGRNPQFKAFREAKPTDRIGNLLIYRGTFHLPELWEMNRLILSGAVLRSPRPDLDKSESYLGQILERNPKSFAAFLALGNLMLRRRQRQEAIRYYERARDLTGDAWMRGILSRQIGRLYSNEPLEGIPWVRSPGEE
jgi:hypothetical protein